jgi:hypothetical protein
MFCPFTGLFTEKYKVLLVSLTFLSEDEENLFLVQAFTWIEKNIRKFAGDKSKVTLLGKFIYLHIKEECPRTDKSQRERERETERFCRTPCLQNTGLDSQLFERSNPDTAAYTVFGVNWTRGQSYKMSFWHKLRQFSMHKFESKNLRHNVHQNTSFCLILSTESSFIGLK